MHNKIRSNNPGPEKGKCCWLRRWWLATRELPSCCSWSDIEQTDRATFSGRCRAAAAARLPSLRRGLAWSYGGPLLVVSSFTALETCSSFCCCAVNECVMCHELDCLSVCLDVLPYVRARMRTSR